MRVPRGALMSSSTTSSSPNSGVRGPVRRLLHPGPAARRMLTGRLRPVRAAPCRATKSSTSLPSSPTSPARGQSHKRISTAPDTQSTRSSPSTGQQDLPRLRAVPRQPAPLRSQLRRRVQLEGGSGGSQRQGLGSPSSSSPGPGLLPTAASPFSPRSSGTVVAIRRSMQCRPCGLINTKYALVLFFIFAP